MKPVPSLPLLAASLALSAVGFAQQPSVPGLSGIEDEFVDWDGKKLAETHCATCHAFPGPSLLPRESWTYVLDLMGLYFGYDDGRMLSSILDERTREELYDVGKYPESPILGPFQWAAIRDFYESSDGSGEVDPPPEAAELTIFEHSLVFGESVAPETSLVKIPGGGNGFYLGDAVGNRLLKYDSAGRLINAVELPGAIVQLEVEGNGQIATIIGKMPPSNFATGSILEREFESADWVSLVEDLHRPVHSVYVDIDGDGTREILVNEFGHYRGGLSLFRKAGKRSYRREILRDEPGSISAALLPRDRDGAAIRLFALNAQARQDIVSYRIEGSRIVESETLVEQPPAFGYTQIHLVDLTGDGKEELVTVNGDNADLPGPPLKRYHGIRIYRILSESGLQELAFLEMPGAFQATFGDFTRDGLTDMAVVSFFPDPRRPDQGFILFENEGSLRFSRRAFAGGALAPWMTVDSGDIDGDGDLDIVLGASYVGQKNRPGEERAPAAMILRNTGIPNSGETIR